MAKDNDKGTVVRRVKASSAGSSAARTEEPATKLKAATAKTPKSAPKTSKPAKKARVPKEKSFFLLRPVFAIGRYFRDSWHELRQVRWTNRRATWALTLAVILFSAFFAIFVLLFDNIFQWLVKEVIL